MKIAIVIVNYNGGGDTVECLTSLQEMHSSDNNFFQKQAELQTIVVDNNSQDNSIDKIENWRAEITDGFNMKLLQLSENKGFAGGNNQGIKQALKNDCDYILLLNNDTLVKKDFLKILVKSAEGAKKVGILGPKIFFAPGYEFHKQRYKKKERGKVIWYAGGEIDWNNMYVKHRGIDELDKEKYNKKEETKFVSGCSLLMKKEVCQKIGLLDEKLFLYYEDFDFCLRAKKAGFSLIYEPKAVVWHKNAQSTMGSGSDLHQYYQTRNRLIIGMRYAPIKTKLALLKESFGFIRKKGGRRQAVRDFSFHRWGKKTNEKN